MASAAPPGHADPEYVIGLALKCPQFECIEGQTHISAPYYIDIIFLKQIQQFLNRR